MRKYTWKRLVIACCSIWITVTLGQMLPLGIERKALASGQTATPSPSKTLQYTRLLSIAPIQVHDYPTPVAWLSWSPDGKRLAVVYEDDHKIRILDSTTGHTEFSIYIPEATIQGKFDLAWSPDGKHLVGTFDIAFVPNGIIKIWTLTADSAELTQIVDRPNHRTTGITWSPDSARIASAYFSDTVKDNILFVWDAQTGNLLETKAHISGGLWSPNGKNLLVLAHTPQLVNPTTFQVIAEFPKITTGEVVSGFMAWSADSLTVVGTLCQPARGDLCHLWSWNIATNNLFLGFDPGLDDLRGYVVASWVALNHSATLLIKIEPQSNLLEAWNLQTGRAYMLPISADYITAFSWNPYENQIAVGSADGNLQIWEIRQLTTL